jgi:hypothetical protein
VADRSRRLTGRYVGIRILGQRLEGVDGLVERADPHDLDLVRLDRRCSASSQLSAGARKTLAPSSAEDTIFCWIPPIGPTVPS